MEEAFAGEGSYPLWTTAHGGERFEGVLFYVGVVSSLTEFGHAHENKRDHTELVVSRAGTHDEAALAILGKTRYS